MFWRYSPGGVQTWVTTLRARQIRLSPSKLLLRGSRRPAMALPNGRLPGREGTAVYVRVLVLLVAMRMVDINELVRTS